MAARDWTGQLREIASVSDGNWTNVLPKTLLLPIIAAGVKFADAVAAFFGIPISIANSIGRTVGNLIDATVGGGALIIDTGATVSAGSLADGIWSQFGPATYLIAIGVVLGGAYLLSRYLQEEETGNVFAFVPFDVPFFGAEEDDE